VYLIFNLTGWLIASQPVKISVFFPSNNLQNKSDVTLRYSNSPTKYVEQKLSSEETKKLYSMLSLSKELKAKAENK